MTILFARASNSELVYDPVQIVIGRQLRAVAGRRCRAMQENSGAAHTI